MSEMSAWFPAAPVRHFAITAILLAVMLNAGCRGTAPYPSKALETKPVEALIEEKYKRLQTSEALTLETVISSRVFISRKNPYDSVKWLKADLKLSPVTDSRQEVLSLEIKPPGKAVGNSLEFTLEDPSPGLHEFRVRAETLCRYQFVRVTDKVSWPFQVTSAELLRYTRPSPVIDSDDRNIRTLASSLAEGEDDLYRVVFKTAEWIKENVHAEFDVSTVYTSQKASWVLENREGVCDEKTNLFIGILRSLGIPAKFITGFTGINYNRGITFKPHGWAEVYFPSTGWIPFDVSLRQLGFIDATHIKLAESVDTSDALTSYEWESIDISEHAAADEGTPGSDLVSTRKLRIGTKIKQETGRVVPLLIVAPRVWHKNVNAGSCNVIEATVSNPHDFYVITDLSLQIPSGSKIMGENNKMILLEPNAERTVYWIVESIFNVEQNMVAIFPVDIVASNSAPARVEFRITKGEGYPKYSHERLERQVAGKLGKNLKEE